jgi:hypothetical protein
MGPVYCGIMGGSDQVLDTCGKIMFFVKVPAQFRTPFGFETAEYLYFRESLPGFFYI